MELLLPVIDRLLLLEQKFKSFEAQQGHNFNGSGRRKSKNTPSFPPGVNIVVPETEALTSADDDERDNLIESELDCGPDESIVKVEVTELIGRAGIEHFEETDPTGQIHCALYTCAATFSDEASLAEHYCSQHTSQLLTEAGNSEEETATAGNAPYKPPNSKNEMVGGTINRKDDPHSFPPPAFYTKSVCPSVRNARIEKHCIWCKRVS